MNLINDEVLLTLVGKYPELYNPNHPQYANQNQRDRTWLEIGSTLKHDANICRERWRRLRDSFQKALNVRKTKTTGLGTPKYYKQFSFLMPYVNHEENQQSNVSNSENEDSFDQMSTVREVEKFDPDALDETAVCAPIISGYGILSSSQSQSSPKYSIKRETSTSNHSSASENASAVEPYLSENRNENADDALMDFFITMGKTVKMFPVMEQVRIKGEIFKIINRTEMALASTVPPSSPDSFQCQSENSQIRTHTIQKHASTLTENHDKIKIRRKN